MHARIYRNMSSTHTRNLVLVFLSAENIRRVRSLIASRLGSAPSEDMLLEELMWYSKNIEDDLRWTDQLSGTNSTKLLHHYNAEFVNTLYSNTHTGKAMADQRVPEAPVAEYYQVSDGLPVVRFDQTAASISADDLLDRWWKGGTRIIQTRDDRHGDNKKSAGDADYLIDVSKVSGWDGLGLGCAGSSTSDSINYLGALPASSQKNVYRGGAMSTRASTWGLPGGTHDQVEQAEHFDMHANAFSPHGILVLGAEPEIIGPDFITRNWLGNTAKRWNASAEEYQRTPLGVSTPAADARIGSRNLTRRAYSRLENGIPYYRFQAHHRHYDREEAAAGLDGYEIITPAHRRWDMSGLHGLIDAKNSSRDKWCI